MSENTESSSLQHYATYPFSVDVEYQQGLATIAAGGALEGKTAQEREEILRRTRVFYFNRTTGSNLSMDDARTYEQSQKHLRGPNPSASDSILAAPPLQPGVDPESRLLTFAELQELIESGKVDQIPNNKVIPEDLNDAPPSESVAPPRKKPWEHTTLANANSE